MKRNAARRSTADRLRELERQNLELGRTLHLVEEARGHYADHYEFAPFGCLTLDSHGCIAELNVAAARLLGYARARLIGKPLFPCVDRSGLPAFLSHLRTCKTSKEKVVSEIVMGRKSGGQRLVEFSSVPVIDPRTDQTVHRTVLVDVTARRGAERDLRQSEERFSKAFRAGPSAAAICTLWEGRFIDVNTSFCKLTGHSRAEAIGATALELGFRPDAPGRIRIIEELRRTRMLRNHEDRLRIKSGVMRDVLVSAEVIDLEGAECVLIIDGVEAAPAGGPGDQRARETAHRAGPSRRRLPEPRRHLNDGGGGLARNEGGEPDPRGAGA
jgi:PAS domain S-box-containing protein